jgi:hypothetical protein
MRPFNAVLNDPNRSQEMAWQQTRILKFICGFMPVQRVVGHRDDPKIPGQHVTKALFDGGARIAQVCPFVLNAIDRDLFWIAEFDLADRVSIEKLILDQIPDFISQQPAFNPAKNRKPAPRYPYILKTWMSVFPNVPNPQPGAMHLLEIIHQAIKGDFVRQGLALGQFYQGCPQEAIYNKSWNRVLWLPYPSFAIRYLVKHDHLFNPPGSATHTDYRKYFP